MSGSGVDAPPELGDVAARLHLENERVRIWEMDLGSREILIELKDA